jgi:hypothetical protein
MLMYGIQLNEYFERRTMEVEKKKREERVVQDQLELEKAKNKKMWEELKRLRLDGLQKDEKSEICTQRRDSQNVKS